MLRPDDVQAIINDLTSIYGNVESACIVSIAKKLGEGKKLGSIDAWRIAKLKSVNVLRQELIREIADKTKMAYKDITREVELALERSYINDSNVFKKSLPSKSFDEIQQSAQFQRVLNSTLKTVKDHLNITGTSALRASEKLFKDSINKAYLEVLTGTSTQYDAIAKACKALGGGGIKVDYASGYSCSLDSAIKRDIVTTINQASGQVTLDNCADLGCDLVETSWHVGARPEHEKWQGKVFSLSGKSNKYPPFYSSTRYGEVDGLCGINCRHSFSPYYEEIGPTTQEGKPSAEENRKAYKLQQQQRAYERNIRGLKYQQQALLSGKCPKEASIIQARLNQTTKNYKQFLSDNNLTRLTLNERVTGYKATTAKGFQIKGNTGNLPSMSNLAKEIETTLKANNVTYNKTVLLKNRETTEQIISKLGGLDKTRGSCSSLAFSYAGRKGGLDVLDFRGGDSRFVFATPNTIEKIAKLDNVKSWIELNTNDYVAVSKLLKNVEIGKEYYLSTGHHASIIRKSVNGFEFLELQDKPELNGFKKLTTERLKNRFKCQKSYTVLGFNGRVKREVSNVLIDIDTLKSNNDFKVILGYINTNETKQLKGAGGYVL